MLRAPFQIGRADDAAREYEDEKAADLGRRRGQTRWWCQSRAKGNRVCWQAKHGSIDSLFALSLIKCDCELILSLNSFLSR